MASNVIPSDKPSIYAALSSLNGGSTLRALVTPNNVPPGGIAGFLFNIPQEETLELESEITDHYVESNLSIQDQIALRPEQVTLRGLVAELTRSNMGLPPVLNAISDTLPLVGSYVPSLTAGALQFISDQQRVQQGAAAAALANESNLYGFYVKSTPGAAPTPPPSALLAFASQQLSQLADEIIPSSISQIGKDLFGKSASGSGLTVQAAAIGYFYQLWLGRMIFTIETPWGIFESMAIQRVRAVQPEDSPSATEIEVRFKRIRIVDDLITPTPGALAARANDQAIQSVPTQLGNIGLLDQTQQQTDQFYQNWEGLMLLH